MRKIQERINIFENNGNQVVSSMEDEIRDPYKHLTTELKAIFVINKKNQEIEDRVGVLEERMTVDYGEQLVLQKIAKTNALKILKGKDGEAYNNKKVRGRTFARVWKDYKGYFEVNSYKNTTKKDFDRAKKYLEDWKPQGKLLREIENCSFASKDRWG